MKRRHFFKLLLALPSTAWAFSFFNFFKNKESLPMITKSQPIDFQWPVQEPFLFCVHHLDHYPAGNKNFGLDPKHFAGRQMGSDFEEKDGFRIYHGAEVPGFPVHPHRGFETITIVRKGYIDHADSLGAAGRYGEGDVQWMTAGGGVQHSEMFPLLHQDKPNTVELFQIWLNLPKANKMVPADFGMLWAHNIPKISKDKVEVSLISGEYQGQKFYEAPKNSWAKDPANEVNILLVKMQSGGNFEFPKAKSKTNRTLYVFEGKGITVNGEAVSGKQALNLDSSADLNVNANSDGVEFLILEAKPIGEPVFQHGPFVMNSKEDIIRTIQDYQRTEFGGWKWPRHDMVHGEKIEKFAKYPNGRVEKPTT
jgi:redox-sensitive bicupin YhaK (pirin superfamily)